jgi:hypothetical protein
MAHAAPSVSSRLLSLVSAERLVLMSDVAVHRSAAVDP